MEFNRRIGCALLACLLLVPCFLPAQSYRTFQTQQTWIRERARWKIGPFRFYPGIQLRNVGYDNNVYNQPEEDRPIADYTGTISPSLSAYLLFRNWIIFSFVENPEYLFFFREKKERALNNSFSPELKLCLFHRFVLSGKYQYQKTRRRASSEFDIRADEESRGFSGQLFYETARQTSIGVSAQVLRLRYEDVRQPNQEQYLSVALNRTEKSGNFEFYYRAFSEAFFFINAGVTDYQFEFRESQWRNSTSFQVLGGLRFPLFGRIRGILALGFKTFAPTIREKKSFSGLVGNTSLDCRLGRFGLRLNYSRDSRISYYLDYVYYLENVLGAGISFYLTTFLRLDYDLTSGRNSYPETIRIQLPDGRWTDLLRKDQYYYHTVGLVFRIFRRTGIGILFSDWKRKSNFLPENRSRWFFGGYVTFDF